MEDEIFKISKDFARAQDLLNISKERIEIIKILPRDKPYKILEEYYEILLGLITAIMYIDGYKTLSHVSAIEYISKNYKVISENQIRIIDTIRKLRHGILYYGKKVKEEYLINNEDEIKNIISILDKCVKDKLGNK
jgi:hypothetical protein